MRRGAASYVMYDARAEEVLKEPLIDALFPCCRSVIASFSLSHVPGPFMALADNGLPCVGCGYVYDGLEAGRSIVSEASVKMQMTDFNQATVSWGSDPAYEELDITTNDFAGMAANMPSRWLEFEGLDLDGPALIVAAKIIKHLVIVTN